MSKEFLPQKYRTLRLWTKVIRNLVQVNLHSTFLWKIRFVFHKTAINLKDFLNFWCFFSQSVNEGEEVVLESVIVSTPAPKVFWYRNNVPVLESDGFQIKHYGDVFKLILKHVNVEHFAGEYKVRAENVAGECQSTCTVQVIENEKRKVPHQTDRHLGIAVSQLSLNAKETEKALTTFCYFSLKF